MSIGSYGELGADVDRQGGVGVYPMGVLRDLEGAGKLGKYIRDKITNHLADVGLGHLPVDLPWYQENQVRVFRRSSPAGRAVQAVQNPTASGDDFLRSINDDSARQRLEDIKRILGA